MQKINRDPAIRQGVAVFFTGGTIGMEPNPRGDGEPGSAFERLLTTVGPDQHGVELMPIRWSDLPSPHMTPERMFELAQDVAGALRKPNIAGAVVLHGTDVLVEAAFMADLVVDVDKPVVYTGAMRYFGELGYDGIRNLISGVQACLTPLPAGMGVVVLMTDRFFAAREVVKIHSVNTDSFTSPESGPVACVAGERVVVSRLGATRQRLLPEPPKRIETNVELVSCYVGMTERVLEDVLAREPQGIVLEGFGAGNVPPEIVPSLEKAVARGIPVVLATRCVEGGVWPIYAYRGGGASLRRMGVILAGRLAGPVARILLMAALGQGRDVQFIRMLFETDYAAQPPIEGSL